MPLVCLTLLVPELLWPEPEDREAWDGLACPALATLLARGRPGHGPRQAFETALAALCGHGETGALAACRRLGEDGRAAVADDAVWLCCDPVHLRFHQDSLIPADASRIELGGDDADALAAALDAELSAWGRFSSAAPGRGYLRLAAGRKPDDFGAPPLSAVAGRRVEHLLADASGDWRALFNEIQMFLHDHPVNRRREAAGQLPVNAFWLWGAGALPARPEAAAGFDGVWSGDPLARGLARAGGAAAHALPDGVAEVLGAPGQGSGTSRLAVLDTLLASAQYEHGADWRAALLELEARWFVPARAALAAGRLSRLEIVAPTAYATLRWSIGRGDLVKIWRRPRAPAQIAGALAQATHAGQGEHAPAAQATHPPGRNDPTEHPHPPQR